LTIAGAGDDHQQRSNQKTGKVEHEECLMLLRTSRSKCYRVY
jgi:hypothetical protein